jgi:hypothetical protein
MMAKMLPGGGEDDLPSSRGLARKMTFFPSSIQRSILLLAHWERLFLPRIGEEGAGFNFVIGK